jgi:hypothetical protein
MSWRDFKRPQEGFKGLKGFKPLENPNVDPLEPLKPLKPVEQVLKNTLAALSTSEQRFADEAGRRVDFCDTHRGMKGGCTHHDITKGFQAGDRIAALNECLLWQLINSGRKIEQAGAAEITTGITVADVLAWVKIDNDVETIRNERRLLLTCARSMSSTRH